MQRSRGKARRYGWELYLLPGKIDIALMERSIERSSDKTDVVSGNCATYRECVKIERICCNNNKVGTNIEQVRLRVMVKIYYYTNSLKKNLFVSLKINRVM